MKARHPLARLNLKAKMVATSQAIDHSIVICLFLLFSLPAFTLFRGGSMADSLLHVGPTFWMGMMGLVFLLGLFYRAFALFLYGQTFGQRYLGLAYRFQKLDGASFSKLAIESLHLSFPLLWAVDFMSRAYFDELNPQYEFRYH